MITKQEIAEIKTFDQFKQKITLRMFAVMNGVALGRSKSGVTDDLDELRDMTLAAIEERFGGFEGFKKFLRGKHDEATIGQLAQMFANASTDRGEA